MVALSLVMRSWLRLLLTLSTLLPLSCGGGPTAKVCAPGATQACLGAAQCAGVQVCVPGGDAWGACA